MIFLLTAAHADTLELRDAHVDACGTVTGELDVLPSLLARTVTVTADGFGATEVAVPPFRSTVSFVLPTRQQAQRDVEVTASWWFLESEPLVLEVPPLELVLDVAAPAEVWAGEPFDLAVGVDAACPTLPLALTLSDATGVVLARTEPATGDRTLSGVLLRPGAVGLEVAAEREGVTVLREVRVVAVGPPCVDEDRDGHLACRHDDCDDGDASVYPGHPEVLGNGVDDDCDGVNGTDRDRDGAESAAVGGTDCDDADARIRPGAPGYADPDGDGAIAVTKPRDLDCDGAVEPIVRFDCAEGDPTIPRSEDPVPTGIDEDCDGLVDEGTVAYDDDGDGLAELAGDCNDADATIRPGARETPDCRDQNCDGTVDEGVRRPARDDTWEDRGETPELPGATWVSGLFAHYRSSSTEVALVTRDGTDVERFKVFAHDGSFDEFFVKVSIDEMGDDRAYEVSISGPGGSRTATLEGAGSVVVPGAAGSNDTGEYEIVVTPRQGALEWCPVLLSVSTG